MNSEEQSENKREIKIQIDLLELKELKYHDIAKLGKDLRELRKNRREEGFTLHLNI